LIVVLVVLLFTSVLARASLSYMHPPPPQKTTLMIGVVSRHIISTISFISSNTTIRDCLYDSCLCICRRRAADIEYWWHNHYCFI